MGQRAFFEVTQTPAGLFVAWLPPAPLHQILRGLDPEAPLVLIEDVVLSEWLRARLPLSSAPGAAPDERTVRWVRFDVLLEQAEFLSALPELTDGYRAGLRFWQLTRPPGNAWRLSDLDTSDRRTGYEAAGVRLSWDIPGPQEVSLIASPTPSAVVNAVARITGSR